MPKKKSPSTEDSLSQADIDAQPFMADEDDAPYIAPDEFAGENYASADEAQAWRESAQAAPASPAPAAKKAARKSTNSSASSKASTAFRAERTAGDGMSTPTNTSLGIADAQIAQLRAWVEQGVKNN